MSLEKRIIAECLPDDESAYVRGVMDAASFAKEADELMRRMGNIIAAIDPEGLPDELNGRLRSALNSYNNWKDQTND